MLLLGLADLQPLLVVALVLGAVSIGLAWVTKQARTQAGARKSVSLTGQHAVHVIELDGERLLIGTGPSGAPRLLTRLPAAVVEPVPSHAPSGWIDRPSVGCLVKRRPSVGCLVKRRLIDRWGAMRG